MQCWVSQDERAHAAAADAKDAETAAFDSALDELVENSLEQNGLADEHFCGLPLTRAWKLPHGAQFKAGDWTDEEGMPREGCPGDVLQMFLWTGTPAQVQRAVHLMREMVAADMRASSDMQAAAWRLAQIRTRRAA